MVRIGLFSLNPTFSVLMYQVLKETFAFRFKDRYFFKVPFPPQDGKGEDFK